MHKETYGMHQEDAQRFEACRFDFRLDSKNGLTPSKRKRSDRRNSCYNTLFKCKVCGSLFDHRAALLEHKLVHNYNKCPICNIKLKSRSTMRQHLQDAHGFGRTSPLNVMRSESHDSVFDDPDLTPDPVTSQPFEETPFSPPASIAQHLQSLKPGLVSVNVPPAPSTGARKQAKPQKIPQHRQQRQEAEEECEALGDPRQQRPGPDAPVPVQPLPGQPPGQAPQGYICISVPIYIGHGQPNGSQGGAPVPPPRPYPPPPGMQPINPTMMMHVPPAHMPPSAHVPPGMVRPPDWQPDSHVFIKEEPPSPEDEKPEAFRMDDLEPGEIRTMGSKVKASKVMAMGPSNSSRFPLHEAGYPGIPPLQPAPPVGGMRLPVAAENHRSNRRRGNPDDVILDLTKKGDYMERSEDGDSCRSTPTLPSRASTPKPKKPKSKLMLDNMVAKLWQNRMSHPDGSTEKEVTMDTKSEASEQLKLEQPPASSSTCPTTNVKHAETAREDAFREKPAQPSRDARRKGRPMKGDTSVNSDAPEGLQFTFINDSESGKMNLVGVSKPSRSLQDGAHPGGGGGAQWTQIGHMSREKPDYCTQRLETCKICGQLFDQTELWEHIARNHGDTKQHKCSKCDYTGVTRSDVLHHKYLKHGAGAGAAPPPGEPRVKPPPSEDDGGKEFMCSACGRGFFTAEDLETHIANHETPTPTPLISCEYDGCKGSFPSQQDLWKHVEKVHQKKWTRRQYACPRENCGRKFINLYHLKRHLAAHKGERQHACNFPGCARTFKEAKNLQLHKMQHAVKCTMCDYKCQQQKALSWHMKAKHGVHANPCGAPYPSSDEDGVSEADREALRVAPASGPVFPGMSPSPVGGGRSGAVDLSVRRPDEPRGEDGVIEVTPVSPEDDGNDGDDDDDDDDGYDDDGTGPTMKKIKFASPHDMKSDTIEVQQIPSVNPNDPPFYTSVMKVKPRASRKPGPSERWTMEQAMGVKFHLCKICKQMFQSSDKMWSHRLVFHDQIEQTKCDKCSFCTDSRSELENHALLNHGKDSTTDHEYVCNLCGKEYTSRHGFKNHMLFRHNEGILVEYPCPHDGCRSKLADRAALKAHYREQHGEPGAPHYRCPFESCRSSFSTLSLLHGHQVAHHEGQTPAAMYSCEYPNCDKVFRELKHLKVHAMLHTNEKPMRCGLCEYTCRQRNSMNWHMKSKHNMQKHVTPEGRTTYV